MEGCQKKEDMWRKCERRFSDFHMFPQGASRLSQGLPGAIPVPVLMAHHIPLRGQSPCSVCVCSALCVPAAVPFEGVSCGEASSRQPTFIKIAENEVVTGSCWTGEWERLWEKNKGKHRTGLPSSAAVGAWAGKSVYCSFPSHQLPRLLQDCASPHGDMWQLGRKHHSRGKAVFK